MKRTVLLFIILLSFSFTQDRSVVITGTCLLQGESDHSDIAVYFQAVSGSAEDNTFYTDENGAFVAGLPEGIYIVTYSRDGFVPQTLPGEINFFSDIELESLTLLSGSVMEVSGTLDGNQHWTPNFQYRVTDDLTLNSGDTLTIDPGVSVLFMGEYEFLVQGAFYANGAEGDSIRFTSGQPSKDRGDWKWLLFDNADPSSFLNYMVVEYGGGSNNSIYEGSIRTNTSTLLINNSHIHSSNNPGIIGRNSAELILNNSLIHNNNNVGVFITDYSTADISGNDIYNNSNNGVYIAHNSTADISGNDIYNNLGIGVDVYQYSTADISGNDIYNHNDNGVRIYSSSTADISGNDIHNSYNGVYGAECMVDISGNDIHNNQTGIYIYYGTADISGNDIHNNYYRACGIQHYSTVNIRNNDIHNNNNVGVEVSNQSTVDTRNNILFSNHTALLVESEGSSIAYNCFYGNSTLSYNNDYTNLPSEFAELITINANGDPSDTWSNLFLDPMLTDIENGDYTPQEGSPVVDAGDPDYQDPDGSIADIGMLYFDWGTEPPVINSINVDNQNGTSPLVVQFSSDISGPATSRQWQFGDGGSSSSANPVHIYSIPGSYTVSLTVDGPGGSASLSEVDFIVVSEPTSPPVANFSSNIQSGLVPFNVQFSNFSQNEIDSYLWDFGDGNTSNEESPAHTYETSGEFTVSLTATGPYGESNLTLDNYITAYEPEAVVASFELSETECVSPCSISLTNTTIGTIDSYSWDFGDGNTSDIENPVNSFIEPGTYTITLTATGPVNEDTFSQIVRVFLPEPTILSISDIPNDNGGYVLVEFTGSGHDIADRTEFYTAEVKIDDNWVTASFSPPYGDEVYGCIVHTVSDSSSTTDGLSEFRILANMDEGVFISESVWGYSVDNIHPSTPDDVVASATGNDVNLSWDYTQDIDFSYHEVSQIGEPVYTISNEVTMLLDTDYNEYYIKSVDSHDNYSDKSDDVGAHNLHSGANLVSFSVIPDDNSINNVITGDILGVIGEGVAAVPNPALGWVGSLGSIERDRGYWVKASGAQIHFTTGEKSYVENYDLHAGANLISYTCSGGGSVLDLVTQDCVVGIIGEGVAAAPNPVLGWVGSLSDLMPGKGYWFKTDQDCQVSYDCPEPSLDQLSRDNNNNSIKDYIQSTEQAFYFIEHIENIEVGDMVSAYCNDIKVGSREWIGAYTDIPAMGNDNSDLTKDYCTSESIPTFRVEKPSGETYALTGDIPSWESNALHMITSLQEAIILPGSYSLAAAYPNPFNPTTTISFAIPADTDVSIAVYNLQGRQIASLASGSYDAGYHSVIWNADTHSSGVYFVKMVAGSYVNTQKLMLVK